MSPKPSRTFWHLALPDFQPQKPSWEKKNVVLDSSLQPFQARLNGGNITVPKLPIQYFPSIYTYMGIDPHYEGLTCSHVPPRLQCCHSALVVVQRGTGTGRPDPAKGGRNHDPCRTQGSTSGIYPTCKLAIYQLTGHPHHLGQHQTHHFRQHPEITHSSHFGRSLWATWTSSLWATRKTSFLSSHYLTQPFRVWLGGWGGDKSVIGAGNKGGIHGLKSSLDSAI